MMRYDLVAILAVVLGLSACATHGVASQDVRIYEHGATMPSDCKALGYIAAGGIQTRVWSASHALRLDLRQNAAYRFNANAVRIIKIENGADGLLAQATAYDCPNNKNN